MKKTQKWYVYFISFAYLAADDTAGFGSAAFQLDEKIEKYAKILDIRDDIQKSYDFKSVAVINYKLISIEND